MARAGREARATPLRVGGVPARSLHSYRHGRRLWQQPRDGRGQPGKGTSTTALPAAAATTLPSGAQAQANFARALQFSECMRSHGVPNFPDPTSGGGIQISSGSGVDPASPQFRTAQKACQKYFPGPHMSQAQIVQHEQQVLAFAACTRKNGVPNFPGPTFGPQGQIEEKGGPGGVNPSSPAFQAAAKKCNGPGG